MKFPISVWLCLAAAFTPVVASAETAKGQTVLASYLAPGQCVQAGDAGALSAAVCARTGAQEFHIEIFNDTARHVSWQKIMSGKQCLQAWYKPDKNNLYLESCYITTYSTPAFWRFLEGGQMRSEDNYCIIRRSGSLAAGAALAADTCGFRTPPDAYPAILTQSARVGQQTLASHKGQPVRAIIVENGYSGGNLVASEGALLKIDSGGKVTATNGGYIVAGGSGYILKKSFAGDLDAVLLVAADADREPKSHSPDNLDFFTAKQALGKLNYTPH